jgi:hypothetical protein
MYVQGGGGGDYMTAEIGISRCVTVERIRLLVEL